MRNSFKVAKWEIKRNMTNKSFVISLFLTPIAFLLFMLIPQLLNGNESKEVVDVFILDELGVANEIDRLVKSEQLNWIVQITNINESDMGQQVIREENVVYIPFTEKALDEGAIQVYKSKDVSDSFLYEAIVLEGPLRQLQLARLDLSEDQKSVIAKGISVQKAEWQDNGREMGVVEGGDNSLKRAIPGLFAAIILLSSVITGMMIFTSASQEKKEKVAEVILSSVTPGELMQGKIIGYFVLGMTQVAVWLAIGLPVFVWKSELPIIEYLFVPQLLLLVLFAIAGYLLFAAIFVAIGATVEDMTTTGNFQGIVMMLPFLPLVFIGPIFGDPSGIIAKVGSFIPFTSPAVWIMRLSLVEEWPWMEISISVVILLATVWLMMKAAGKVFEIGMLMHGKNATPKEIWKWLWI
ncbi:ABC transporter permease [Sporosarcina thermotolerans]|uniref:ABC transporter permease n=1 Tax=Sporosarcina thermotolerans TaxID=633404 RepID=A0AAW9ADL9_9BACL|nr:ABC transporter permease [Sporosarcina thermotolerans]MDW0118294.1 ABC transporter permease [Sporosarcina thermotolerans]